ncbi:hypothetical protein WN943_025250 [Citrus x changshan-huyou]
MISIDVGDAFVCKIGHAYNSGSPCNNVDCWLEGCPCCLTSKEVNVLEVIIIWLISLRERQEMLVRLLPFRMVNPLWLGHLVSFNGATIFNVNELERPVVHYYVCL